MVKLKFKKQIWQVQGRKALRASFRDSDGDGVINMFDCQPRNKRKQGEQHKKIASMTEEERQKIYEDMVKREKENKEHFAELDKKILEEEKLKKYLKKYPKGKFDADFD